MSLKVSNKPVEASGTKTKKDAGQVTSETSWQTVLGVVEADEPLANVGFRASMTKNLGNYESVRIEISVYMPCAARQKQIDKAYEYVKGYVEDRMEAELSELESEQ